MTINQLGFSALAVILVDYFILPGLGMAWNSSAVLLGTIGGTLINISIWGIKK